MMWLKVTFVSLEMLLLIRQVFSANLFKFGNAPLFLDGYREMEKSVHRGLFLALMSHDKNEICQNIYGSQYYIIDNLSQEDQYFYGRPCYVDAMSNHRWAYWNFFLDNLTVRKMGRVVGDKWKLHIKCSAEYFKHIRKPLEGPEFYITYAFKPKWFVVERKCENNPNHFIPTHYAVISPDPVRLTQVNLEKMYVNIWRNFETIRRESPEYMKLIEGRDSLSNLSDSQKFALCGSILSSKRFHKNRLEFSLDWMNGIKEKRIDESLNQEVKVFLKETDSEDLPAVQCILCKGVEDVTKKNSKTTNVYVTGTYRDSYSAFALIETGDGIVLHTAFVQIPVLMPGHEDMNVGEMFLNFDQNIPTK